MHMLPHSPLVVGRAFFEHLSTVPSMQAPFLIAGVCPCFRGKLFLLRFLRTADLLLLQVLLSLLLLLLLLLCLLVLLLVLLLFLVVLFAGCSLMVAGGTAAAADGQAWCHGTGTLETVLRLHAQAGAIHFSCCWHAHMPWHAHMCAGIACHSPHKHVALHAWLVAMAQVVIGCGVWCRCMGALHVSEGCWMAGRRRVGRHTEWWASGAGGINKSAHMST